MNRLLLECFFALGTDITPGNPDEVGHLGAQGDGCSSILETVGAEGAIRFALDRLGAIVRAVPKDDLIGRRELLLKLLYDKIIVMSLAVISACLTVIIVVWTIALLTKHLF